VVAIYLGLWILHQLHIQQLFGGRALSIATEVGNNTMRNGWLAMLLTQVVIVASVCIVLFCFSQKSVLFLAIATTLYLLLCLAYFANDHRITLSDNLIGWIFFFHPERIMLIALSAWAGVVWRWGIKRAG
jgi:hypothetical protein